MAKRMYVLLLSIFSITLLAKSQNTYNEISLPELMKKKQSDKNIVIVDVRTKGEYYDTSRNKQVNIGRIRGAINIVFGDLQRNPDAIKQLDAYKDKDVYLICSHSYRSRSASNILLKNGFNKVNNVRGGMTDWYRRYDEMSPYMDEFLEKEVIYNNLAPSQLLNKLFTGKKILLIGIRNNPRYWYDSFNLKLFRYYPLPNKTIFYNYADSLTILEEAQKDKERSVILFNMVNSGAAELAEWLTQKGVQNVSYLVGGASLFYEYVSNKQMPGKTDKFFSIQSGIHFITAINYCAVADNKNVQLIDVRHDTLFNKVNQGTKHDYKHLKNALNFFSGKGTQAFEKEFPDKNKDYILISANDTDGLEFADALTRLGYKISWMIGGLGDWEWYMNNVEDFKCNESLAL